jgi:hypothetical protein
MAAAAAHVHIIIQQVLVQVDLEEVEDVVFRLQQILVGEVVELELVDLALLFFQYQLNFIRVQKQELLQLQLLALEQF